MMTIIDSTTSGNSSDSSGGGIFANNAISITDSTISGNTAGDRGGGVMAYGVSITRSTISENSASTDGGGIYSIWGESSTFIDSTISGNSSGRDGGGIFVGPETVTLVTNSSISGNSAGLSEGGINAIAMLSIDSSIISENTAGGGGGGIRSRGVLEIAESTISGNSAGGGGGISGVVVTIDGSTISDNSASGPGGGIRVSGEATINNSTIIGNTAGIVPAAETKSESIITPDHGPSGGQGGGISIAGSASILNSIISGNSASRDGGGILAFIYGSISIVGSTISGNSSGSNGGGISTVVDDRINDSTTIASSTISGNSADNHGGGVYFNFRSGFEPKSATITHSTIVNNFSNSDHTDGGAGGGIFINRETLILNHTMVAENTDYSNVAPDMNGLLETTLDIHFSLIGDNSGTALAEAPVGLPDANGNLIGGPSNGIIEPLLGPLADNGGPTQTHALLLGSPAIDAGDSTLIPAVGETPEFDQRGTPFTRVVGTRIDIGAVEQTGVPIVVDTLTDENDGDLSRWDVSLREAIELANNQAGNDTIFFDPALTGGTILLTLGELLIADSLMINGLGADQLTIDASGNDPTPDVDDGLGSRIFNIDDRNGIVDLNVGIARLTLTGGDSMSEGGAILSQEKLLVYDSVIVDNHSLDGDGGGIYATFFSTTTITDSTISNNSAGGKGGGARTHGQVIISGSTFASNTAGGLGGGIFTRINTTITNSIITGNTSSSGGGGIFVSDSASITGSTISDNTAGGGGGIGLNFGTEISISNSTISGNSADSHGGGIYASPDSYLSISDSTISENVAGGDGGGISAKYDTVVTITSSIILDNSAGENGGGIYSRYQTTVAGSTITTNSSGKRGGGIYSRGPTEISNSTISGNSSQSSGGGVWVQNSLTIDDSTISDNSAGGDGGGIRSWGSTMINSSSILGNSTTGPGGGFLSLGTAIITSSKFEDNVAGFPSPADTASSSDIKVESHSTGIDEGGGIWASGSILINNSTISGNSAFGGGGGLYVRVFGTTTIVDSTFSQNLTESGGGGIWIQNRATNPVATTITDSTISGNSANGAGGGIWSDIWNVGSTTISNSTISDNTAVGDGCGVYALADATTLIVGSTISDNSTDSNGGGVYFYFRSGLDPRSATITHSTIVNNFSNADYIDGGSGGGIFINRETLLLDHAVVAGNSDYSGIGPDITGFIGVTLDLHYSLIGDNKGTGFTEAPIGSPDANGNLIGGTITGVIDPLLAPLADNGGPTQTHALLPGSPASDAGNPALTPGVGITPEFDQRGNNYGRIQNGRIDIGAFEVRETLSADFDTSGRIDGFDFLKWQQGFGLTVPNATKPEGDADNDLDIDRSDFNVWENQFGQLAPAVVVAPAIEIDTDTSRVPVEAFSIEATAELESTTEEYEAANLPVYFLLKQGFPPKQGASDFKIQSASSRTLENRAISIEQRETVFSELKDFLVVPATMQTDWVESIDELAMYKKHEHAENQARATDELFAMLEEQEVFAGL